MTMVATFLLLGGAAFLVAVCLGIPLMRRGVRALTLVAAGMAVFVALNAYLVWWASGSCGPDCSRDPTPAIALSGYQLGGWLAGLGVAALVRRRAPQPSHE